MKGFNSNSTRESYPSRIHHGWINPFDGFMCRLLITPDSKRGESTGLGHFGLYKYK